MRQRYMEQLKRTHTNKLLNKNIEVNKQYYLVTLATEHNTLNFVDTKLAHGLCAPLSQYFMKGASTFNI